MASPTVVSPHNQSRVACRQGLTLTINQVSADTRTQKKPAINNQSPRPLSVVLMHFQHKEDKRLDDTQRCNSQGLTQ